MQPTKSTSKSQFSPFDTQRLLPFQDLDLPERLVLGLGTFSSSLVAVVGIGFGDEGKGRTIPDAIQILRASTGRADIAGMVVKVNGGANSGHTVDGLKLNLFPGAVGDTSVRWLGIGRGVVADPIKFYWEGHALEKQGYTVFPRLLIDNRAMISDITHRVLDKAQEHQRDVPRGSTGRGISPAFGDEVGQHAIRFSELLKSKDSFTYSLKQRIRHSENIARACTKVTPALWRQVFEKLSAEELKANASAIENGYFEADEFNLTRFCGDDPFTFNADEICDAYWRAGQRLRDQIGDLASKVAECQSNGQYVFGEFGQAYFLDKRHGYAPNVTASHTFTPELPQSLNVPYQPIHVIGVSKAYDTKVGTHLFLTEIAETHPLRAWLQRFESATTTGRQRMVGWFDAVEKGHALRHGGFNDMVINKIDVLTYNQSNQPGWDGMLKICCGYQLPNDSVTRFLPDSDDVRKSCRPIYLDCPSWTEDISDVRSFYDLPLNAQRYVATLYAATIVAAYGPTRRPDLQLQLPRLRLVGVGPDSSQVILNSPDANSLLRLAYPEVYEKRQ